MTVEQIAKKLNDCANKIYCKKCTHSRDGMPTMTCEEFMIKEVGAECRKIVEAENDDLK